MEPWGREAWGDLGKKGGHEREPGEGPKGEERGERARGKKEGPQYEKRSK